LTDEHIFPEAIGGRIQYAILCKQCNSNVGRKIDAPFLTQKNIQMARSAYKIAGKTGSIPQPFSEIYTTTLNGVETDFKIKSDFSASFIPTAPEIFISESGAVSMKFNRDVQFAKQIPKIIETSLRRFFASQEGIALGWSEDQIANVIKTSIESAKNLQPVESQINTEISGKWEIDLRRLFSEHVKIIYEIACLETDGNFSSTNKGEKIRSFLYDESLATDDPTWALNEKALELSVCPILPDEIIHITNNLLNQEAHTYHIAIVSREGIVVSTLGFGAMLHIDEFLQDNDSTKIYFNDIKDGTYGVHDLAHFLPA
jgi:hypothetical protein